MSTREDIAPVLEKALALLDEQEGVYEDGWKRAGGDVCFSAALRKAVSLRVQHDKGIPALEKYQKDLLDLINWAAFAYWHSEEKHEQV